MKKLLIPIILLTLSVSAQIITSDPVYPTENDSIIIYYDATLGDGGLKGYTGDVYTHTGVTINGGRWQHVIESWGNDDTQPKLIRTSTDRYKLVIGNPHEFYGVSTADKITELCFVFRSAGSDGPTGRDVGGDDIFYALYEPGLTVFFEEPVVDLSFDNPQRSPVFQEQGDTLNIIGKTAALGTQIQTISLIFDENILSQVSDSVLDYQLPVSYLDVGQNLLQLVAIDTAGSSDTSSIYIMVNPSMTYSPLPVAVQPGINILNDQSVVLTLFAPYKDFVYVIGDFNDWTPDTSYYMNCYYVSDDSVVYWLQIDQLDPTTEYGFQYLIDGELRIADPYTRKILDPWNDRYISSTTYSNLKSYPDGKTKEAAAVFQTVQPEYANEITDFNKPLKQDLVIYELLIRDFVARHDYQTMIDTLNYLENLGINAIELMPVSEFEGNSSWGYNPSFHFALDKYYGPPEDFKQFVDECHNRGIAVIMDMVLNHVYGQSPLVRMYWNATLNRPAANNPWFNEESPNPVFSWGSDFDHESKHTQYYVDRVCKYWMTEFKIDGFRFDFTKGFTNTPGDGGAYDAKRINILQRIANEIWKVDDDAYIILEHFAANDEEQILADYGLMLWGNSNWNYAQSAMGYSSDSDFSWGYFKTRNWTKPHLVTYMESHDEERLMYKNLTYGNAAGDYDIQNPEIALRRMKIVNAFFLTLPGPKMIWQFGELGYDISIDDPCRVCEKPFLWQYNEDVIRQSLYKTIAALLKLRSENAVFTNPGTNVTMSVSGNGKRIGMNGTPNVVIIGNFGVSSLSIAPNFQHVGNWFDFFSGDSLYFESTSDPIELAQGEFHIFTDTRLETPEAGIINNIDDDISSLPKHFALYPNYPNPFNATTKLCYDLEKQSNVRIKIFDLSGREVYSELRTSQPAGSYIFNWDGKSRDGRGLHSGIYFFLLQRDTDRIVRKLTLLK